MYDKAHQHFGNLEFSKAAGKLGDYRECAKVIETDLKGLDPSSSLFGNNSRDIDSGTFNLLCT